MTGKTLTFEQAKAAHAVMAAAASMDLASGSVNIQFTSGESFKPVSRHEDGAYLVHDMERRDGKIEHVGRAERYETLADFAAAYAPASDAEDFPLGKACDLSGDTPCEACQ